MQKAVIVAAFANTRTQHNDRLSGLLPEEKAILDAFQKVDGLVEIVPVPGADVDDVWTYVERYRDRLVGFHYAGHASEEEIVLQARPGGRADSTDVKSASLVGLLGICPYLKVVFLNGCSTHGQLQALMDAGIPHVIGTTAAIPDDIAAEFSAAFYQALASRSRMSLEDAFAFARAKTLVHDQEESDLRVYRDRIRKGEAVQETEADYTFLSVSGLPEQNFLIDLPGFRKAVGGSWLLVCSSLPC